MSHADAVRYKQADKTAADLTKGWLLKVKKLWNETIADVGYDTVKTFRDLRLLLNGVRETVLFERQGYNTRHDHFSLRRKFEEAFKTTITALDAKQQEFESVESANREAEYALQELRLRIEDDTGDRVRAMGADVFYAKHPDAAALKRKSDETYEKVHTFRGGRFAKTIAPVTRAFDAMMKILYQDAQDLAEARERGMDVHDYTMNRVFDLHGMKVVALDPELTASNIRKYLGFLDLAYKDLSRKGFAKSLWRGVCFIEGKEQTHTPEEMELRKQWGYTNGGSAAHYIHGKDEVHITAQPGEYIVHVLVHEMGHRYWFKEMSSEQRARFNALVRTRATERYRDFPQGPTNESGHEKPVAPLNDYASSNIEEAFAEVFEAFVMGKDLNRDQLESFKSVLPHKFASDPIAARVVARFLDQWPKPKGV